MPFTYLIIDALADATDGTSHGPSILTLPLGRRSFLDQLYRRAQRLAGGEPGPLLVLPTFPTDGDYAARLAESTRAAVQVVSHAELESRLARADADDAVVVYDAARWPAEPIDPSAVRRVYQSRPVPLYVVGTGAPTGRALERVDQDSRGQVRKVERAYADPSPEITAARGAFLAIVPARMLRGLKVDSVGSLRAAIGQQGVEMHETTFAVDVLDLRTVEGTLAITAQMLARDGGNVTSAEEGEESVVVGEGCRIDASVRLVGPVVVHDGVEIGPRTTVVGPAVIGRDSTIGADAVVAQVVVASRTRVAPGVTLRHCIVAGECTSSIAGRNMSPEVARLSGVVGPPRHRISRVMQFAVKRLLDTVLSALALVVLSPLLGLIALLIKLTSPGPVFFIHRRERADGKEFGCVKFRTMTAHAHLQQEELLAQNEVDGPQFKLKHDPRVTRLGAWLRTTNLDELPQLFNVVAGHMSLIGPRPSPFRENQICVPWRRARLSVRPGITGLWQICRSADRTAGDFHEWIFYDMAYVRNFSLWLDLKILLATVLTLGGRMSVPITRLIPDAPTGVRPRESLVT